MITWKKTTKGNLPKGAIPCGHDSKYNETLYTARVEHYGTQIGKVGDKEHPQAHIPYDGKELLFDEFEVLTLDSDDIKYNA